MLQGVVSVMWSISDFTLVVHAADHLMHGDETINNDRPNCEKIR